MRFNMHRLCLAWGLTACAALAGPPSSWAQSATDIAAAAAQEAQQDPEGAFATTVAYMIQFFPLWTTSELARGATAANMENTLSGPNRIAPAFRFVLAPSSDTLYAASFLNLTAEPIIVTIPKTSVTYSIVTADPYFEVLPTGIPPQTPGVYGLVGPGFSGQLPAGITPVPLSVDFAMMVFRTDQFSAACEDQTDAAKTFRASLKMQPLSKYLADPTGGATEIRPVIAYAPLGSVKARGDALIAQDPMAFLQQLQAAVASPRTPPLSAEAQKLSGQFNALFASSQADTAAFSEGVRKAFSLIVAEYMTHTGPTLWTHYTNLGRFDGHVLERAAGAEFAQVGNLTETALYYNTFKDVHGQPLDGHDGAGYVLTFSPGQIPHPTRFWSVSAYTREAEAVIRNPLGKYHVANCTPGLQTNPDGSLSIYVTPQPPEGVPVANWLPIGPGKFTLWQRIYGPEAGANENYVPPAVVKNN
ncbi:MAG TPA: DUF1214 domain-containing protein [Rhodopila sp.]|nr:DUF1214 domain-containing protein [Rhodopila sp.]